MDAPKYQRIHLALRRQIDDGLLRPGERLPSIRRIAADHGVSVITAQHALHQLGRDGLAQAQHRARFVVCAPATTPRLPGPSAPPLTVPDAVLRTILEVLQQHPRELPLGGSTLGPSHIPDRLLRRLETDAYRRLGSALYGYEVAPGNAELRRAIARRVGLGGQPPDADDVTLTHGCMDALRLALEATTREGDSVLVERPSFFGLYPLLQRLGRKVVELPFDPAQGLRADAVAAALAQHRIAAACLTPCYHNPTGALTPEPERRAIGQLFARQGIPLIEDDVYAELSHLGARPTSMLALAPDADVITCGSVSKMLAPGLRLGWAVRRRRLPGDRYRDLTTAQFTSSIATATAAQAVVARLLVDGGLDRHLARLRPALQQQVSAYRQRILQHFPAGTTVTRPQGGFLLWVALPTPRDPLWLMRAAREIGVGLVPGCAFSLGGDADHCLRLSAGHVLTPAIERAIADLGQLLSQERALP